MSTTGSIACLCFAVSLTILVGCRPSCDSAPTEALGSVRIVNAVSNSPLLLVYVDGKLFDSAWYDVLNKYAALNPKHIFGYRTTYLSDGSPLRAGLHHVAGMDAMSRDTVATWDGVLHGYNQTLIFPGKINGSPNQTPEDHQNPNRRVRYLDDVTRGPEIPSYARFVQAIPDIGGTNAEGLDVYFANTPKTSAGQAHPNLRIRFDSISNNNGLDNGTGMDPNDYLEFPQNVPGLLIMPINDTDPNDAILNFPHALPTTGFLVTIIVRGETNPVGDDPIPSVLVVVDGQPLGPVVLDIESIGVRIVNATRYDSLSLLISDPTNQNQAVPRTFSNTPYSSQASVTDIIPDSVSDYMPLGVGPSYYNFWFGSLPNSSDTVFHFSSNASAQGTLIIPPMEANMRYTFVAIDTIPNDAGNSGISLLELFDTVSNPVNSGMGRVRFVNTTCDYTAEFNFAGQNFSMKQGDVTFADINTGTYSVSISGGGKNALISIPVQSGTPTTVFFMPSNPFNPLPYCISTQ